MRRNQIDSEVIAGGCTLGCTAIWFTITLVWVGVLIWAVDQLDEDDHWLLKQHMAGKSRYYGDGGTIHHTGHIDVETYKGEVVSAWFRCQTLPFNQVEVEESRAESMRGMYERHNVNLSGVEVVD